MDSRFYNKGYYHHFLYPQDYKCFEIISKLFVTKNKFHYMKENLTRLISEIFKVNTEDVFYFSSASAGLTKYLTILRETKGIQKVYIPDFSCMELADAVIESGCMIEVYDIEDNLLPSINTLREIGKGNNAFLLPALFGKNEYSDEFISEINKLDCPIIFDEAQAFPNISFDSGKIKRDWAAIVSFGRSKPISGMGGGALINHHQVNNSLIAADVNSIKCENYYKNILCELGRRLDSILRRFRILKRKPVRFDTLEDLVFNKDELVVKCGQITKLQIIMAYKRTKRYLVEKSKRKLLAEHDPKMAGKIYGNKKLENYHMLPVKIEECQRYELMTLLGNSGVQPTIYYYPLHLIPYYNRMYNLSNCQNSLKIFSQIVIIGFNMDHNISELNEILHILDNSLGSCSE